MHDGRGEAWGRPLPEFTPGERVAGFTIEGKIASGSFGTVFAASRDGRTFALKLVPMGVRGDREVDALRRAQFPNVVSFRGYSLWPDDEPQYLVLAMEWVEGRPLDVWAREENPSALELVRQVLVPLAGTLADVHAAGVVHRDVKEANVVICEADGQPVLVDFGAAGYEGAPRLTMRLPPGTPEYRGPEALRFAREWEGEPYPSSPGDDLWALGVMTYALLTRTLPFGDRHGPDLVHAILHETPPAPHGLNPRVPPALGALCMRMLEKAPEARYASAQALEEALEDAAARADASWRVPLFPGGRWETPPAPAPAARARPVGRGRPWAAGLGLGAAVVVGVLLLRASERRASSEVVSATPRIESPVPSPSPQAVPRHEVASTHPTGEVGPGTANKASPTPVPVARATPSKEPAMTKKSPMTRSLLAAGCIVGSACASGPRPRPPPKPAACPPGAAESFARLGIGIGQTHPTSFREFAYADKAIVREGEVTVETVGKWGKMPDATLLTGRVFFGTGRVYGRFTRAYLPSGETMPVCFQWVLPSGLGVEMKPSSTAQEAHILRTPFIEAASHFD